jgi:Spy/CpxP family protein refolding chaperone
MKHKRIVVVPLVALALLAAGATAVTTTHAAVGERFADRPIGRLLMGRIGRLMTLKSELNLTADQKQAIATTLSAHKAEIAKALQPVVEKGRALRAATAMDNPDEAKIRSLADDLGKAIGDAAVVGARARHDVKAAAHLTDEQAKRIADFHAGNQAALDRFLSDAAAGK